MSLKRITKRQKRVEKAIEGNNGNFNNQLMDVEPLTKTQSKVFNIFQSDQHLVLHGYAGTGKTFLSVYLSLREILGGSADYKKIVIIRSTVASRDQGFMPGGPKDKAKMYERPYETICTDLFGRGDAYQILKTKNYVDFESTSFLRGDTFHDSIIIVDEMQNMTGAELSTIITRVGNNCKIIFCGDFRQTDFNKEQDKRGLHDFLRVLKEMDCFSYIEFGIEDIVRSGVVKQFIIAQEKLNIRFSN